MIPLNDRWATSTLEPSEDQFANSRSVWKTRASSNAEETAWATTDLVLQLLVIFVVGAALPSTLFEQADLDRSITHGPQDASMGRELTLQFFLLDSKPGSPRRYRLMLESSPKKDERLEVVATGRSELGFRVRDLERRIERFRASNPGYQVRRILVAPKGSPYQEVLGAYSEAQTLSPGTWYLSSYDPESFSEIGAS